VENEAGSTRGGAGARLIRSQALRFAAKNSVAAAVSAPLPWDCFDLVGCGSSALLGDPALERRAFPSLRVDERMSAADAPLSRAFFPHHRTPPVSGPPNLQRPGRQYAATHRSA